MKKGWIWIILIGVLCAAYAIIERLQIERLDTTIQLVVDAQALELYAEGKKLKLEELVKDLTDAKINTLAVPEVKLWEAASKREQLVFSGTYLLLSDLDISSIDPRKIYILDDNLGPISQRLAPLGRMVSTNSQKLWEFDEEYPVEIERRKEAEKEPTVSIWDEAIYPDYQLLDLGFSQNVSIVSRIQNPYLHDLESLTYLMEQWQNKQSLIIFQGKEVLGYPNNLDVASKLIDRKPWGLVEFANQYGEKDLARLTNYNLVRVHSITPEEMLRIDPQVALERYLRAVRERGARVLYLRPFNGLSVDENAQWFRELTISLQNEGYDIGVAKPKPFFKSSVVLFLPVVLAIIICGIRLMLLLGFKQNISLYSGVLALLVIAALYLKGYTILARQISAFGAALIFPTLAIGTVAEKVKDEKSKALSLILTVLFYMFIGVLYLTAALLDLRFVIKVEQFLGVKLMHILPPILSLWLCFKTFGAEILNTTFRLTELPKRIFEFVWPPRIVHVLLILLVVFAGFVYIGRTGHDWGIPVLKFEENLRVLLERIFIIRPRLKESFIGHPALVLGLLVASSGLIKKRLYWALPYILTVGSIGVTSVLNTFSHAHTPILVSVIRTVWGLGIGAALGILGFLLLKLIVRKDTRG